VPFYRSEKGGGQLRGRWPAIAMGINGLELMHWFQERKMWWHWLLKGKSRGGHVAPILV
jgi:hypothetical protein